MSDITDISPETVAEAAISLKKENLERHRKIVSIHYALTAMLKDETWSGKTAESAPSGYYNQLVYRYFVPFYHNIEGCALHLKSAAENHKLADSTNREFMRTFEE